MRKPSSTARKIQSLILECETEGCSMSIRSIIYEYANDKGYNYLQWDESDFGLGPLVYKRLSSAARSMMRNMLDSQPNLITRVNINGTPHYYKNHSYGRHKA